MNRLLAERLADLNLTREIPIQLRRPNNSHLEVDVKRAYGDPNILSLIADELFLLFDREVNVVACSGFGGIPLASSISLKYGLKLTMVRDKKELHGKQIEGYSPSKEDLIGIVDDSFSTGRGLLETISVLRGTGARINRGYVVCNKSRRPFQYPLKWLLTPEDLAR